MLIFEPAVSFKNLLQNLLSKLLQVTGMVGRYFYLYFFQVTPYATDFRHAGMIFSAAEFVGIIALPIDISVKSI
jgi:hypothetical protein